MTDGVEKGGKDGVVKCFWIFFFFIAELLTKWYLASFCYVELISKILNFCTELIISKMIFSDLLAIAYE